MTCCENSWDDDPLDSLFQSTKKAYATDRIFEDDERINLKPATGEEIVRRLEKYNLSDTSEDVKGVAFERFLGRTFRGEIGQFFTPRSIVEFMVHMVDPQEGEIVCDPASGSGGFLIRTFEVVREKILADADHEYNAFRADVEADASVSDAERARRLQEKYRQIQARIDHNQPGSRLWNLSNRCIYGTDANDRMARTSKMNMIMHGDGHGGVHHHDGFLNVNGIFEGRFDIVLTNPPFGANVEPTDKVLESDIAEDAAVRERYLEEYGNRYSEAQDRVRAALNQPITTLFDLPRSPKSKIKTEVLFIERCLDLLKPGGRLGIVLPEGLFNNPSLAYVREFIEARAFLSAVVSLPQETFVSSGASVKCSLLFLRKFGVPRWRVRARRCPAPCRRVSAASPSCSPVRQRARGRPVVGPGCRGAVRGGVVDSHRLPQYPAQEHPEVQGLAPEFAGIRVEHRQSGRIGGIVVARPGTQGAAAIVHVAQSDERNGNRGQLVTGRRSR